jgi:hypothetical protein
MFIAFEGPDNVGKSTSAATLATDGVAIYNATKDSYDAAVKTVAEEPWSQDIVFTWDRIDWFSHMVYRLAMPDRDWNDDRPRTVFAAPDMHLVIKLHHESTVGEIKDELYEKGEPLRRANSMYRDFAAYFAALNASRDFELFKSVSIIEVYNSPAEQEFSQRLLAHLSASVEAPPRYTHNITDNELVELLRRVDHETF